MAEHILLIEDELDVLEMQKRILEHLGFQVTARLSSREALDAFEINPQEYDLVITDLHLPGLKGTDIAESISAIRPDLPIIVCTGFVDDGQHEVLKTKGIRGCLHKPFSMREMHNVIRSVCDGRQERC